MLILPNEIWNEILYILWNGRNDFDIYNFRLVCKCFSKITQYYMWRIKAKNIWVNFTKKLKSLKKVDNMKYQTVFSFEAKKNILEKIYGPTSTIQDYFPTQRLTIKINSTTNL